MSVCVSVQACVSVCVSVQACVSVCKRECVRVCVSSDRRNGTGTSLTSSTSQE